MCIIGLTAIAEHFGVEMWEILGPAEKIARLFLADSYLLSWSEKTLGDVLAVVISGAYCRAMVPSQLHCELHAAFLLPGIVLPDCRSYS